MIFASGLAILVAALLLPAFTDLRAARAERDKTLHIEKIYERRIDRYQEFLNELQSPSKDTVQLLAMSQMGVIPSDREAVITPGQPQDTLLLEYIEPQTEPFVAPVHHATQLERLTTSPRWRLWVVAGGLFAVMYGLMPATKPA